MTDKVQQIDVDLIEVKDHLSRTKLDITSLMTSLELTGQINPIIVRPTGGGRYRVVAGRRRCTALKMLQNVSGKKVKALCVVKELDKLHEELIVIDENLMREQLSDDELDEALFRRKQIYEQLHPETKQHVAGGVSKNDKTKAVMSFTKQTAHKLKISPRKVEKAVARASKASDAVKEARRKGLSQSKVDLLVALSPKEQDLMLPVIMDKDLEKAKQLIARAKTRGADSALEYVREMEAVGKDHPSLGALMRSVSNLGEAMEEAMKKGYGLKNAERFNNLRKLEEFQALVEKFVDFQRGEAAAVVAIRRSGDAEKIIRARVVRR